MSTPVSFSGRARDLNFTFQDSCNCCCFGWRISPRPSTQVYVNREGEVNRFLSNDSTRQESLRKCVSNLRIIIEEMAEERSKDKEKIFKQVESRIISLDEDSPMPVTAQVINRIKEAIESGAPSPVKIINETIEGYLNS